MRLVTREQAQHLADLGYLKPTQMFWDRYNPNQGDESLAQTNWRLVPSRGIFDKTCCLPAPTIWRYWWEVLKRLKRPL